jgi:hypothetical protein
MIETFTQRGVGVDLVDRRAEVGVSSACVRGNKTFLIELSLSFSGFLRARVSLRFWTLG